MRPSTTTTAAAPTSTVIVPGDALGRYLATLPYVVTHTGPVAAGGSTLAAVLAQLRAREDNDGRVDV